MSEIKAAEGKRRQRAKVSAAELLAKRRKTIQWYMSTSHLLIPKQIMKRKLRYALHEMAMYPDEHNVTKMQMRVVQEGDAKDEWSERYAIPGEQVRDMIQFVTEGMFQEVCYKALQIAHHCKRIKVKGGDLALVFELEEAKYGPARTEHNRPPEWMF